MASGELVCAYFAVIDVNGVLDVKFLGIKPIEAKNENSEAQTLLLEGVKTSSFGESVIPSPFEKVSHYFTLDFLVNQLARAPSA